MRFTKFIACAIVWGLGCGLTWTATQANIVNYADTFGSDVTFGLICETSTNPGPFYGQPVAAGNMAASPGLGFLTQSTNGELEMVNGRLQMTITADPGFQFSSVTVTQLGSILGFGNDATVQASGNATIVTGGGNFSGSLFFENLGAGSGSWSEDFTVHFPATDVVSFTLDHQLLSAAGPASGAFIDTSSIQISVSAFVAGVPEAHTVVFLSLAAVGLGICRTRRRI